MLQILHGMLFQRHRGRSFLQYICISARSGKGRTEDLPVQGIRPHSMYDRKTELALRQILTIAFVVLIFVRLEVHIVVSDLEEYGNEVDEGNVVSTPSARPSTSLETTERAGREE